LQVDVVSDHIRSLSSQIYNSSQQKLLQLPKLSQFL